MVDFANNYQPDFSALAASLREVRAEVKLPLEDMRSRMEEANSVAQEMKASQNEARKDGELAFEHSPSAAVRLSRQANEGLALVDSFERLLENFDQIFRIGFNPEESDSTVADINKSVNAALKQMKKIEDNLFSNVYEGLDDHVIQPLMNSFYDLTKTVVKFLDGAADFQSLDVFKAFTATDDVVENKEAPMRVTENKVRRILDLYLDNQGKTLPYSQSPVEKDLLVRFRNFQEAILPDLVASQNNYDHLENKYQMDTNSLRAPNCELNFTQYQHELWESKRLTLGQKVKEILILDARLNFKDKDVDSIDAYQRALSPEKLEARARVGELITFIDKFKFKRGNTADVSVINGILEDLPALEKQVQAIIKSSNDDFTWSEADPNENRKENRAQTLRGYQLIIRNNILFGSKDMNQALAGAFKSGRIGKFKKVMKQVVEHGFERGAQVRDLAKFVYINIRLFQEQMQQPGIVSQFFHQLGKKFSSAEKPGFLKRISR